MRKFTLLTILALMLQSCATQGPAGSRTIAGIGSILDNFISQGLKSADNLASKAAKEGFQNTEDYINHVIRKSEKELLAEINASQGKQFKNLDDAKKAIGDQNFERFLGDFLPRLASKLKFTTKSLKAATETIQEFAGLAAKVDINVQDLGKVQINPGDTRFVTKLGRKADKKVAAHYQKLLADGQDEAAEIFRKNVVETTAEMRKKINKFAEGSREAVELRRYARDLMDAHIAVHQKSGVTLLGEGGCAKIDGLGPIGNWSEIGYRVMKDVDDAAMQGRRLDPDEVKGLLVKHQSEVTNRTLKEACFSVRELASQKGKNGCGGVWGPALKPDKC